MKSAGRACIFEIRDLVGSANCQSEIRVVRQGTIYSAWVRSIPLPFYDGLFARLRAAWEIVCRRAYPIAWPEPGDLERALQNDDGPKAGMGSLSDRQIASANGLYPDAQKAVS